MQKTINMAHILTSSPTDFISGYEGIGKLKNVFKILNSTAYSIRN